jgi:hypothetical protein
MIIVCFLAYAGLFINNLTLSKCYCKKTSDAIGTCSVSSDADVNVPPLPQDLREVRERITNAVASISMDDLVKVCDELEYRTDVRVTHCAHIENL